MEFGEYRFAYPIFMALALLLPIGLWLAARIRRGTLRFSSIVPFRAIRPTMRVRLRFVPSLLRLLVILIALVALSRPQKGTALSPEKSRGIGILLLIDSSASMRAEDFRIGREAVSRIDAVKSVVKDFVKGGKGLPGRPHDEIGIVSFTGYPVPRAPLTLDHGAILEVLDSIDAPDPEKMERDARGRPLYPEEFQTAIGDALAKGSDRLRDVDVKSKVMVLLSDGSQTAGVLTPEEGARIAENFGVKVYTIGIGQPGTIMVTVNTLFGPVKRPQRSDLDERSLKTIAEITGGKYFNAATTDALREVYEEIDALERSEIETTRFYRWDEKFQPLALAGLFFLAMEILLSQTIFRRIP